ncbi:MAG: hypothetical protein ACQETV_00865 [Actinomycetota bacterium]
MRTGPLRRVAGTIGLLALAPTGWLLATGQLTVVEAAWRAGATLLLVSIAGRVAGWFVEALALSVQPPREGGAEAAASSEASSAYVRRREDHVARQAATSGGEVDDER